MARNEMVPQNENFNLLDPFTDLFKDFTSRFALSRMMNMEQNGIELSEDDTNVYVHAPMPGLKPNDIDVNIENGMLQIKGERKEEENDKNKKFYRKAQRLFCYQVALPSQVDDSQAKCDYNNGVLELTVPKTKSNQTKKIKVNTKQSPQT